MRVLILPLLLLLVPPVATSDTLVQQPAAPFYFAVDVGDIDLVRPWYEQTFGVTLIDDSIADDGRWRIANLGNDQFAIELIFDRRSTEPADGVRVRGFAKLGVSVPDVELVADRVEAAGGERPRVLDFEEHGIRLVQLKDPEGNTIQLHSPLEPTESDQDILLRMHRNVLRYHVENDLDAWMADESEDHVIAGRGEISHPTTAERRARVKPYLDCTTFSVYRDLVDPIVQVSDDGSLGWVICQVEVEGECEGESFRDVWVWIELYEKREGRWLRVGNVSSAKPDPD